MELVEDVKERLAIFKNLYDVMRIVDPVNKKTITITGNSIKEVNAFCYELWKKGTLCKNCVSTRAHINQDTFIKIEYNKEKILLIIATPIEIDGDSLVAEFIKDITQNGSVLHKLTEGSGAVEELISSINEKAIKDELTGIFNRRYINERLQVDINYSRISKLPLSVVMADIDFFKSVNDKYGHVNGDRILVDFSNLMQKSIRNNTDWVARYGGEEFIIVLNDTDIMSAYAVAEKIRKQLENTTFKYEDVLINITASFGVYCVTDYNIEISELLSIIDRNLYEAKVSGRNKTVINQKDLYESSISDISDKNTKLSRLTNQINELRDVLNEVCCTIDSDESRKDRLIISEYLDKLIVEYMKELNNS